jgi:replication-associated recombination protein RarA
MKLNIRNLWQKHFIVDKQEPVYEEEQDPFEKIVGCDGLKRITKLALESEDNYNLLFQGPPASAKTMFLEGIIEYASIHGIPAVYFDATNLTTRMLDVLEQERPQIILIDEIEKLQKNYQEKILNFAESGKVKVDQMTRQYDFTIAKAKIFATANDLKRLSKPLQSRFRKLTLPAYTEEQFMKISSMMMPHLPQEVVKFIAEVVWKLRGDIRQVLSISKLVKRSHRPEDIMQIVQDLAEYSGEDSEKQKEK